MFHGIHTRIVLDEGLTFISTDSTVTVSVISKY